MWFLPSSEGGWSRQNWIGAWKINLCVNTCVFNECKEFSQTILHLQRWIMTNYFGVMPGRLKASHIHLTGWCSASEVMVSVFSSRPEKSDSPPFKHAAPCRCSQAARMFGLGQLMGITREKIQVLNYCIFNKIAWQSKTFYKTEIWWL